jgi:hypothetical protein
MGSYKHAQVFGPLDLEIIDRVYDAAWAELEAREPFRDRERETMSAGTNSASSLWIAPGQAGSSSMLFMLGCWRTCRGSTPPHAH